jgi:hypothetical protein
MGNRVHLSTDIEKYVWSLFEGQSVQPDTVEWRLRDKLLDIVKRWKSSEYRYQKVVKEADFYSSIYKWSQDETTKRAIETCVKLAKYIEENS